MLMDNAEYQRLNNDEEQNEKLLKELKTKPNT